jgi:hypothetical protein
VEMHSLPPLLALGPALLRRRDSFALLAYWLDASDSSAPIPSFLFLSASLLVIAALFYKTRRYKQVFHSSLETLHSLVLTHSLEFDGIVGVFATTCWTSPIEILLDMMPAKAANLLRVALRERATKDESDHRNQ